MGREMPSAKAMTEAAEAFLPSLSPELRASAAFDFDSTERHTWHYIPKVRGGAMRGRMDEAQLDAADRLMASGLSRAGFEKAKAIIAHESILDRIEEATGGTRFDRSPGRYYHALFGDPSGDAPWGWRTEGHHLSLNYTIVDGGTVASTPSFFGANPAEVKSGPEKGLRILSDEEDTARELLLSLDDQQHARANIYPVTPADIISRASPRVEVGHQAGLPAESMTGDQREILMRLIGLYVDKHADDLAANAMARIEAGGIGGIPLRVGRLKAPGAAPLLPAARPDLLRGVRQHPGHGQPHPLGLARHRARLRLRPAQDPLPAAPPRGIGAMTEAGDFEAYDEKRVSPCAAQGDERTERHNENQVAGHRRRVASPVPNSRHRGHAPGHRSRTALPVEVRPGTRPANLSLDDE